MVKGFKSVFAQGTVTGLQQGDKRPMCDRMGLLVAVQSVRKLHVCIIEQRKNFIRSLTELTGRGKQRLTFGGERVRTLSAEPVEL